MSAESSWSFTSQPPCACALALGMLLALAAPAAVCGVAAQPPRHAEVAVETLATNSKAFTDAPVRASGSLHLVGSNYFRDPYFVLMDDEGHAVRVRAWLPLEVPPPREPGATTTRPRQMRDVMGRRVSVSAVVRVDPDGRDSSLHVESATVEPGILEPTAAARQALTRLRKERAAVGVRR